MGPLVPLSHPRRLDQLQDATSTVGHRHRSMASPQIRLDPSCKQNGGNILSGFTDSFERSLYSTYLDGDR
jgi:hypothetical protein